MKAMRDGVDRDALAGEAQRTEGEGRVRNAGPRWPSAPKNTSPKPCSARWQPTEAISNTSTEVCAIGWNAMR